MSFQIIAASQGCLKRETELGGRSVESIVPEVIILCCASSWRQIRAAAATLPTAAAAPASLNVAALALRWLQFSSDRFSFDLFALESQVTLLAGNVAGIDKISLHSAPFFTPAHSNLLINSLHTHSVHYIYPSAVYKNLYCSVIVSEKATVTLLLFDVRSTCNPILIVLSLLHSKKKQTKSYINSYHSASHLLPRYLEKIKLHNFAAKLFI